MFATFKNFIASFLMIVLIAPFLYLGVVPVQKVEAQASIVLGGVAGSMACYFSGYIEGFFDDIFGSGLSSIIGIGGDSVPVNETNDQLLADVNNTAATSAELLYKECVLDPIIWVIKRILINFITQRILDWTQNGIDDGPIFMTHLNHFFRSLALKTLNTFIDESGLSEALCEPFRLDVSLTLRLAEKPTYGLTGDSICSLEDILKDSGMSVKVGYDTMVSGGSIDFEGGGITAAMGLAIDANNGYGALFTAQADVADRIGRVVSSEATLLDYGNGFLSSKCPNPSDPDSRHVCTPGQIISQQLDDHLGGALGQLEVADEISEVLTELFAALVTTIFTDPINGLLADAEAASRNVGEIGTVTSGTVSEPTPYIPPVVEPPVDESPPPGASGELPIPGEMLDGTWVWLPSDTMTAPEDMIDGSWVWITDDTGAGSWVWVPNAEDPNGGT